MNGPTMGRPRAGSAPLHGEPAHVVRARQNHLVDTVGQPRRSTVRMIHADLSFAPGQNRVRSSVADHQAAAIDGAAVPAQDMKQPTANIPLTLPSPPLPRYRVPA